MNRTSFPTLRMVLAFAGLVLYGAGAQAVDRQLNVSGIIHSVSVENRVTTGPGGGGTRLVHQLQRLDGTIETRTIPGTDESTLDVEPVVAVSPATGQPMVAWSRQYSSDFEITVSFFDGSRWCNPRVLTANGWDDRLPQIVWGASGFVHMMWAASVSPNAAPAFFEAILDAQGAVVVAATEVRLPPAPSISDSAGSPANLDPDDVLFSFDASPKTGPRRVVGFGGYDDPVPVSRRADFELSSGSAPIDHTKVRGISSWVVLFLRIPTKLVYSVQSSSGWTPLRQISLDNLSEQDAEMLVREMVARSAP